MSQVPGQYFLLEVVDGVTVARLAGPKLVIDAGGPLYGLVDEGGHGKLLLDFAEIEFLSSAALGVLVALKKKVDAAGGRLKLCRLSPDLLEMFRLTRIADLFVIHQDEREALARF